MTLVIPIRAAPAVQIQFIPDPGYSFSGVAGFDSDVVIGNSSAPFGPTGPTLVMFDDFRSGTQGVAVANNTPGVAGSSNWLNSIAAGGNSVYQGPSRSGSGNCLRVRKSGDSDVTYEALNLQFANTNAFYIFFAENSHGVDYNTLTGAGTGNNWNYKLNWLMFNNITAHAFNMVMMDIIGQSGSTFQQFGSNDSTSSGGPLPLWDSGSGASYDNNNWTSIEYGYVADPNNPTTATGMMFHAEYCPRNSGRHGATSTGASPNGATTNVLFNSGSGSAGTYSVANSLAFPGLIEGAPSTLVIDRADVYVAIGPNCLNRFFIGNSSAINTCTSLMPCTVNSWGASAVGIRLRQGAFSSLSGNYLYWSDNANNINRVGQFA